MDSEVEKRKENLIRIIKEKSNWIIYILLIFIIWFSSYIRTLNLPLLKDITTGKYMPGPEADTCVFLRYTQYILEHGHLMDIDPMRYVPLGANINQETIILPYFIAYLYKILHFFNSSITIELVDVLYPVLCFAISTFFFFLLVEKLFDKKIALLSTAFLVVLPTYLYRTIAGFADKEALGMTLMFISMYLYVSSWQSKNLKNKLILASLSGIFSGLLALAWGGISLLLFLISIFILIEIFLDKFYKEDFYIYSIWLFITLIFMTFLTAKYNGLNGLTNYFSSELAILAFLVALLHISIFKYNLFKIKDKIKLNIPDGILSFLISLILGIIIHSIIYGLYSFLYEIKDIFFNLTTPYGRTRFQLTVAEAHQPYTSHWISALGWIFIILMIVGSILLFYETIKHIKSKKNSLTILYSVFIISLIFNRYSPTSILNGVNTFSHFLYIGIPILFWLYFSYYYLKTYYKDKDIFKEFLNIDREYIFILLWLILMLMAARSAQRLLFVFSPAIVIPVSYLLIKSLDYIKTLKENYLRIISYCLLFFIILSPFASIVQAIPIIKHIPIINQDGILTLYTKETYITAKYIGPAYNQQWQEAMAWVRNNTPKNAVFAHWWDYGYWVQTGGERATVTDGGNWIGYWNHLLGRHLLTAQSETEALEFLKTHNVTHLLIISDEIGKYGAYASIGGDENNDRFSQIFTYVLNPQQTVETRNSTLYIYTGGGFPLDEDLIYQDILYPRNSAFIAGFILPITNDEKIEQPTAVVFYKDQRVDIPLECVFVDDKEINFPNAGIKGCLRIIPFIKEGKLYPINAALYISEKVRRTLFAQLYLFNKKWLYIKEAYNDENRIPLALYENIGVKGPLKIWEINYPENIKAKPEYLATEYPNENLYVVK